MTDDNNNKEVILMERERNAAITDYKSVLYRFVAKPDSMTKIFGKAARVECEDIIALKERICEKIETQFGNEHLIIYVDVNMSRGKNLCMSWEEFCNCRWDSSEHIKNLVIKFDFLLNLPDYEISQRHTLVVRLSAGLNEQELMNLILNGKIEDLNELDLNMASIVARVDFVNQTIGDELLNIVANWVDNMEEVSFGRNPFILFFRRFRRNVAYFFNYIFVCICSLFGIYTVRDKIISLGNVLSKDSTVLCADIFMLITIFLISLIVIYKISQYFANKIFVLLQNYTGKFMFEFTTGDKKLNKKFYEQFNKNQKRLFLNFVLSILLNVGSSLIANLIIMKG